MSMSYYRQNNSSKEEYEDSDDASGAKREDSLSEDEEDDVYSKRKDSDHLSDQDDPNQHSDYDDTAQTMGFRQPATIKRGLSSHSESSSYYGGNEQEGYSARKRFRASSSQSDDGTLPNAHDSLELSSQSESEEQQNHSNIMSERNWLQDSGHCSKRSRNLSVLSNSTSADSDRDDEQPAPTRSIGHKMLQKMGFQEGMGLGKHAQGMTEPIAASKQRGKRGLGFKIEGLITQGEKFKPEMEVISVREEVQWLNGSRQLPTSKELRGWMVIGPRKLTIDNETLFCHPNVLNNILLSKSVFDKLEGIELSKARSRANPFETIKGVFFLNRAAMKMANLDAVFDFMFTDPKDRDGNPLLDDTKLLYFADVCAGPGGFSEYVLWRKRWRAKGIGFTLKGPNDFKLENFYAAPCETFEPYYGVKDDGNVYDPDNIDSLYEHVMTVTDEGVHFMMADGGFSVEGQENIQEILSKRLYLCQCLVALRIVRPGGHFVVKLFDLFTSFSVGLVYLMHTCFDRISIHKPNTSRPANSERYLICEFKRDEDCCAAVIKYLTNVNKKLDQLDGKDQDVNELVHNDILTAEGSEFFNYITESNNTLGERQVVSLLKIAAFSEDPMLVELRQNQIKKECLKLYGIEEKPRMAPPQINPISLLSDLWKGATPKDSIEITSLQPGSLSQHLKNPGTWKFCVVGSRRDDDVAQPTLFYGQGGPKVLRLEGRNQWVQLPSIAQIELPRDTLILGELIPEFEGDRAHQKKVVTLHILDAVKLAGDDVRHYSFDKRLQYCELFAKAIRRAGNLVIHKMFLPLPHIVDVFDRLQVRTHKNGSPCRALPVSSVKFLKPGGMLCMPCYKYPWVESFSRTQGLPYFFNTKNRENSFDMPEDAVADFRYTLENMKIWWWDEGVRLKCDRLQPDYHKLQPEELLSYVPSPGS